MRVYQEMAVHVPILSHYNPKSVLIFDQFYTGLIHEVLKYEDTLEKIDLICESPAFKKSFLKSYPNYKFETTDILNEVFINLY